MTYPTISIIANFYNSAKFIPKLIKSVMKQTYADWELICVNDCSPANDQEILEKYAARDKRIRVIRNEVNLGISRAKKVGIEAAHGKYLTFIDGDDWLAPEALERMIKPAEEHDIDIVIMNDYKILPIVGYKRLHKSRPKDGFDKVIELSNRRMEDYIINFYGGHVYNCGYWGKLFKSELVKSTNFEPNDNPAGEDFLFNFAVLKNAHRIYFIDYAGYYWRWGGLTSGKKSDIFTSGRYLDAVNDTYLYLDSFLSDFSHKERFKRVHLIDHRNSFYANVSTQATQATDTQYADSFIEYLDGILHTHTSYNDMELLPRLDKTYENDPVVNAIIDKDAATLYSLAYSDYRKGWKKRLMRRILHKILYII